MARKRAAEQPALFVVPEIPAPVVRQYAAPIEARATSSSPSPSTESAPRAAEEDVIVTPMKDGRFLVATLRHFGTTSAHVVYTRRQLQTLVQEARFALSKS